jgi:MFS family permease
MAPRLTTESPSCGRQHVAHAGITALLWAASLLLFTFAHIAAMCAWAGHDITFAVASSAMALGAVLSGLLSDRIGRSMTAKFMFGMGAIVCVASIAAHPSDTAVLLVLAASAGIAAGGSHVAAELLLEAVPPKYRAWVMLMYPALFFPVGLVQSGVQRSGWSASVTLGGVVIGGAMVGLLFLPESRKFVRSRTRAAALSGGHRHDRASSPSPSAAADKGPALLLELARPLGDGPGAHSIAVAGGGGGAPAADAGE